MCLRQTEKDLAGAQDTIREFNERKDAEDKEEMAAAKKRHGELVEHKRLGAEVTCALCVALSPALSTDALTPSPLSIESFVLATDLCSGASGGDGNSHARPQERARQHQEEAFERVAMVAVLRSPISRLDKLQLH